jgi:hypothetical protein
MKHLDISTPIPAEMSFELIKAVVRGAAFLDEQRPGWAAKINLRTLDLEDCGKCILGQLLLKGSRLSRHSMWVYDHGFDASSGSPEDYGDLAALWAREIKRRRKTRRV